MSRYKSIPIAAAKRIARDFDKDQVIVVTWDKAHGKMHVTTYGRTVEECAQAAQGGNAVKKALGWPESLCNAQPSRVTKLQAALEAAVEALKARQRCKVDHGPCSSCATITRNALATAQPLLSSAATPAGAPPTKGGDNGR